MLAGDIVVAAGGCRFCPIEATRGIAPLGGAHTSALRGNANFASFAPTKAAQRILAESIARELWPKGSHVGYLMIDAVNDVAWTQQRFKGRADEFFIQPAAIAHEAWQLAHQPRLRMVVSDRGATLSLRSGETRSLWPRRACRRLTAVNAQSRPLGCISAWLIQKA